MALQGAPLGTPELAKVPVDVGARGGASHRFGYSYRVAEQTVADDEELTRLSRMRSLNQLTLKTDMATDETLARIAELKHFEV